MGDAIARCMCVVLGMHLAADLFIQILHLCLQSLLIWLLPPFGDMPFTWML